MVRMFPAFAAVLKVANISGKKALAEFGKWALQDAEVGFYEAELEALGGKDGDPAGLLGFLDILMDKRSPNWLMGWRDITPRTPTNARDCVGGAEGCCGEQSAAHVVYDGETNLQS
jgi:hypothetical protein